MAENSLAQHYSDIVAEITKGGGIHIEEDFLSPGQVAGFVALAESYEPDRFGTVRGLLDKSPLWAQILEHPVTTSVSSLALGPNFQLGSVDIKYFHPENQVNVKRVIPHVDYPGSASIGPSAGVDGRFGEFTLGLKFFIPLTDLTIENGATAYLPGSQNLNADPELYGRMFFDLHAAGESKRLIVKAGTLAIWNNRFWHAELGNRSAIDKLLMHICVVHGNVTPPHALDTMYGCDRIAKLNSRMRARVVAS